MQLTDSFRVPVAIDQVWDALLDVERVAPCMPGASVDRVDGDDINGSVKIKLGPITMRYQGTITMTEKDVANHRAVMTARAREARGNGSVNAAIAATLASVGEGTEVTVVTDLDVTGKAAQFGRGVMGDVSRQLMGQFAGNLAQLLTDEPAEEAAAEPAAADALTRSSAAPAGASPAAGFSAPAAAPAGESLDALALIKAPLMRVVPPVAVALVVGIVLGRVTKRRRRVFVQAPWM
jgi:uncharacterized protein